MGMNFNVVRKPDKELEEEDTTVEVEDEEEYESIEDNEEQSLLNIVHKSNLLINEITKFQIKHKEILLYDDFVKESLAKKVVK